MHVRSGHGLASSRAWRASSRRHPAVPRRPISQRGLARRRPPRAERLGCGIPSERVSPPGVSAQASPRPPGPMTAAAAQRQADSNKKQSFSLPLSPPTRPPPASPSLPVLCKASRHRRSGPRYQTGPREPRPVAPGGPSRRSGVRPHPGSPARLRRVPRRPAARSGAPARKALTMGPNFKLATGRGGGQRGRGGGRARPAQACSVPRGAAAPPRPRLHVPGFLAPPSRHTKAPSPVTRVSPVGLPGAAGARDAASPSLPPRTAERAPGPRAAGGPRRPHTVLRPHPAALWPPEAPPSSESRKVLSPPARPRAPQTPYALSGQLAGNSALRPLWGASGGQQQNAGYRRLGRGVRGLRGPGQAPVPGPQVHVKVRRQVPRA